MALWAITLPEAAGPVGRGLLLPVPFLRNPGGGLGLWEGTQHPGFTVWCLLGLWAAGKAASG